MPDDSKIKSQGFSFMTIDDINELEQSRIVDVAGVITQVGALSMFQPKPAPDGTPKPQKERRTVTITDESKLEIQVTLWSGNANKVPFAEGRIVQIKGAKVSDYGGRSLNAGEEHSQVFLDGDHKRVREL
jgi:replication factor A1